MKQNHKILTIVFACLTAFLWQDMVDIGNYSFDGNALFLIFLIACYFLYKRSFSCNNKRLCKLSYSVGFIYSLFTVVCIPLLHADGFPPFSWMDSLLTSLRLCTFTAAYGSIVLISYEWILNRPILFNREEKWLSRVTGNYFVLFFFFLLCYLPIFVAFYPGSFTADSVTQFWQFYNDEHSTHHPLLHTWFLGTCMMFGIDLSADGLPSVGIAIYNAIQIVIICSIFAYALVWLRKRHAPLWSRITLTLFFGLFPFYPLWTFSVQKDTLFSGFILLFLLLLIDIWQENKKQSVIRIILCVLSSVLMMLLRNNGIYALCVALPFIVLLAKGARIRITAIIASSIAITVLISHGLASYMYAETPCKIELLSVPLQQVSRTLQKHPEAIDIDTAKVLDTLYDSTPDHFYHPLISDPVRWNAHYDQVDANLLPMMSLWLRMGVAYPKPYVEAFLIQNLPYLLPGTNMLYHFDLAVKELEMFPIETFHYFPLIKTQYSAYGKTLTFADIPGVRLLSDTAFYVWVAIFLFGLAWYRKEKAYIAALIFLFAIWLSALAGPVAIIRYMLPFFYVVPVLFSMMLRPKELHS